MPASSNTGELGTRSRRYGRSTPTITAAWRRPAQPVDCWISEAARRISRIIVDLSPRSIFCHFRALTSLRTRTKCPFRPGISQEIVMIDVLHHLQRPLDFLREAARVLKPHGRVAMIEPGMSVVARRFYQGFHQEPVDMGADVFAEGVRQSGDDPF